MKLYALWAVTRVVGQVFLNGVTLNVKELRRFEVTGATRSVTYQKACTFNKAAQRISSFSCRLMLFRQLIAVY
jgi:hypothetical protein